MTSHHLPLFSDRGKFCWFDHSADIKTDGTSNSCHYKRHRSPNHRRAAGQSVISHCYVGNKCINCSSGEVKCKTVQRRRKQSWTMWREGLRADELPWVNTEAMIQQSLIIFGSVFVLVISRKASWLLNSHCNNSWYPTWAFIIMIIIL